MATKSCGPGAWPSPEESDDEDHQRGSGGHCGGAVRSCRPPVPVSPSINPGRATRLTRPAGAGGRARDSIAAPPSPAARRAARGLRTRSLAHVPRMRHAARMPKMIQVRSVPDRLHRELVRRARKRGRTVTSYIQEILEREVSRPLAEEVFEQIARATPVDLGRPAADFIREERASRGHS